MPYYSFVNPKTKKNKEIFFHMNDEKIYIDEKGVKWERQFTSPQTAIDTKINEFSSKDFAEKTGKKAGTLKNIWEASKECSIKREERMGRDEVKETYYDNYKKKRKSEHPDRKKQKAKEQFKKMGVDVEL